MSTDTLGSVWPPSDLWEKSPFRDQESQKAKKLIFLKKSLEVPAHSVVAAVEGAEGTGAAHLGSVKGSAKGSILG